MYRHRHDIKPFLANSGPVVCVSVEAAKGSTPREAGTWMLVSADAIFRTIGGGQLEYMAIDKARRLLSGPEISDELSIPLGPEIGQCCGGHVTLQLHRLNDDRKADLIARTDREFAALSRVYVFGAGHVGNCLIEALSLLPVWPILVDTREAELAAAPDGCETCLSVLPEAVVREAPAGAAFVVLTHDHALDFLIVREALARKDAAYVGMIGSKTKRTMFARWFENETGSNIDLQSLICPIGAGGTGDKRPEVIASLVAAEIMTCLPHNASAAVQLPVLGNDS